jgi:hypothetical protein
MVAVVSSRYYFKYATEIETMFNTHYFVFSITVVCFIVFCSYKPRKIYGLWLMASYLHIIFNFFGCFMYICFKLCLALIVGGLTVTILLTLELPYG